MNTSHARWRLICWNVAGWPTHGYERIGDEIQPPAFDDPSAHVSAPRFRRINRCSKYIQDGEFVIACLQEAWVGRDVKKLRKGWAYAWRLKGDDLRNRPGLLTLGQVEPQEQASVFYDSFGPRKGDFIVRKGAAFTRWPFGWVCNTHLDAGRGSRDKEARAKQIRNSLIPRLQTMTPFILVGDLNLKPGDHDDENLLNELKSQTGAVEIVRDGKDFVLASPELKVTPLPQHPAPENGLSDHSPVYVEISLPG